MPHSHNDPGWLQTFEQYFEWRSKKIINNMVQKLNQYPNMTFIWTEISFLNAWWESSHPVKRKVYSVEQKRRRDPRKLQFCQLSDCCAIMVLLIKLLRSPTFRFDYNGSINRTNRRKKSAYVGWLNHGCS